MIFVIVNYACALLLYGRYMYVSVLSSVFNVANFQAGGTPLVGCPRVLIQYIGSYPPYLEAVSSIRNLRTRHALVKRDPLNMGYIIIPPYYT
jgi:hypothetical protein